MQQACNYYPNEGEVQVEIHVHKLLVKMFEVGHVTKDYSVGLVGGNI